MNLYDKNYLCSTQKKKKVEICPPTGTSYKYNDMSNNEPKCKIVTALNLSQYEPKQQIKAYILA